MRTDEALARLLAERFGLLVRHVEVLDVAVNDVARIDADEGRFALKLYHPGRTYAQVVWEVDLLRHLGAAGVPVALPVEGPEGPVVTVQLAGRPRVAVLLAWPDGVKPRVVRGWLDWERRRLTG